MRFLNSKSSEAHTCCNFLSVAPQPSGRSISLFVMTCNACDRTKQMRVCRVLIETWVARVAITKAGCSCALTARDKEQHREAQREEHRAAKSAAPPAAAQRTATTSAQLKRFLAWAPHWCREGACLGRSLLSAAASARQQCSHLAFGGVPLPAAQQYKAFLEKNELDQTGRWVALSSAAPATRSRPVARSRSRGAREAASSSYSRIDCAV
eukprot:SAG11_NODE_769_length_7262_cov_20.934385_3_plen_210_part_00